MKELIIAPFIPHLGIKIIFKNTILNKRNIPEYKIYLYEFELNKIAFHVVFIVSNNFIKHIKNKTILPFP